MRNNTLIKRIASYVWDIPIEQTSSPQNDYLEVVWSNGIKMLNTKEANFSFGNGYKVFEEAMSQIPAQIKQASNILVLGFGCGSILHLLEKQYNYSHQLVGVEYDAEIIRLYHSHFAPAYSLKPHLHNSDAANFLERNTAVYDVIFIDLFYELENSPLLYSDDFRNNLKRACKSTSTLVFNTTSKDKNGENLVFELQIWLSEHFTIVTKTSFQNFNQIIIAHI